MSQLASQTLRRNYLLILYLGMLTLATMYAPQPLLSSIHGDYAALSNSSVALIIAVTILPLGIAPLVYGFYLRSLDSRRVLLTAVSLVALIDVALFFCQDFWGMVALRLGHGLIIPALLTCLMAQISSKFSGEQLQRALAIYIGMTVLGGVLGRLGAGVIASWLGWRYTFVALAAATVPALLPLWRLPAREGHQHIAHVRFSDVFVIWRTPGMAQLLSIESLVLFLNAAISNYLPFYLTAIGAGISEWRIALLYMGNIIGVFMAFASRWFITHLGNEARAIRFGLCVMLAGMPALICGNLWLIFLTMCVVSVGQFLTHSICPGLINRLKSGDKGAVNGVYLSAYYTGGAIGAYVPGFVYSLWGWDVLICCLVGVMLLAMLCTVGLGRFLPHDA